MISHASHYLAVTVICVFCVRPLGRARWPLRMPRLGIVAWQALLLSVWSSAIGLLLSVALSGYGPGELAAVWRLAADMAAGRVPSMGAAQWAALVIAAALAAALLLTVASCAWSTAMAKRRHRRLLDLVAVVGERGVSVVTYPRPVAYCLPGRRPRLVISSSALSSLDSRQLEAVLTHEHAHLSERHDLVVLPFAALRALRIPGAATGLRAVALLVECRADDRAILDVGRLAVRRALSVFARQPQTPVPPGAFGAHTMLAIRLHRISVPPARLRLWTVVAINLVVWTVVSTPWSLLAYPW